MTQLPEHVAEQVRQIADQLHNVRRLGQALGDVVDHQDDATA